MTLNNLSTIVPFGVHGYYVIDSMCGDLGHGVDLVVASIR